MIKTVKVKKQFRLEELIKYIRDNRVREKTFRTDEHGNALSNALKVDEDGLIETYFPNMHINNSFTVEVEEEVTKRTLFDWLVEVNKSGIHEEECSSISSIEDEDTIRIYALLDEKLQLIWEAE